MYTDWPFFHNFLSNVRVSVSLLVCTVLAAVEKLLTLVSCPSGITLHSQSQFFLLGFFVGECTDVIV
jgi:hypothetical protein